MIKKDECMISEIDDDDILQSPVMQLPRVGRCWHCSLLYDMPVIVYHNSVIIIMIIVTILLLSICHNLINCLHEEARPTSSPSSSSPSSSLSSPSSLMHRINHCCAPNAAWSWVESDSRKRKKGVRAIRKVTFLLLIVKIDPNIICTILNLIIILIFSIIILIIIIIILMIIKIILR